MHELIDLRPVIRDTLVQPGYVYTLLFPRTRLYRYLDLFIYMQPTSGVVKCVGRGKVRPSPPPLVGKIVSVHLTPKHYFPSTTRNILDTPLHPTLNNGTSYIVCTPCEDHEGIASIDAPHVKGALFDVLYIPECTPARSRSFQSGLCLTLNEPTASSNASAILAISRACASPLRIGRPDTTM